MTGRHRRSFVLCGCTLVVLLALCTMSLMALRVGDGLSSPAIASVGPPPPDLPRAEDVRIASASGSVLRGWWVPARSAGGGTVVLMHGIRSNRLATLPRARVLGRNGFSVLLFDFQAHGESPGRRITGGKLEALDAEAAVRFARLRRPGEKVGVIGLSLGGAAVLLGPEPLDVDAAVLEAVYPDIDSTLSNFFTLSIGRSIGAVAAPVLVPLFDRLFLPTLGVTPAELRPIDHAAAVAAPTLVMGGTEDDLVPPADTAALFKRFARPGGFWLVEGAGHVDLEGFAPEAYWAHVLPFLWRTLREGDVGNALAVSAMR